jgi:hypothetical protein
MQAAAICGLILFGGILALTGWAICAISAPASREERLREDREQLASLAEWQRKQQKKREDKQNGKTHQQRARNRPA